MSKQFKKLVTDEELYEAICSHLLEIDRPKYNKDKMSLQDYGALCVAYDTFKVDLQKRLDSMYLAGQEDVV